MIVMTAPVSELEEEIAHLRDPDLSGLRARWHSVFRRKAPDHLPRHLLYRMIAYRRNNRRHRRTGGLPQAPRQHDDLAGLPGTERERCKLQLIKTARRGEFGVASQQR